MPDSVDVIINGVTRKGNTRRYVPACDAGPHVSTACNLTLDDLPADSQFIFHFRAKGYERYTFMPKAMCLEKPKDCIAGMKEGEAGLNWKYAANRNPSNDFAVTAVELPTSEAYNYRLFLSAPNPPHRPTIMIIDPEIKNGIKPSFASSLVVALVALLVGVVALLAWRRFRAHSGRLVAGSAGNANGRPRRDATGDRRSSNPDHPPR